MPRDLSRHRNELGWFSKFILWAATFLLLIAGSVSIYISIDMFTEIMPVFDQQGDGWVGLGKVIAAVATLIPVGIGVAGLFMLAGGLLILGVILWNKDAC